MIKLTTVLRGISIDIRNYAISQPDDLTHFLALAVIFQEKADEVEQQEGWSGNPGLQVGVGVFHLSDQLGARLVKAADWSGRLSVDAAVKVLRSLADEVEAAK